MELRPGYKQTEVGVIPEEWDIRLLGDLAATVASGKSKAKSAHGTYPVHGSTSVIGYSENGEYEGDAILVARVGANAGKLTCVSGKYGVTDNTIIVRLESDSCLPYIWRQLESKRLNSLVFGSGQPLITGTQLKSLPLCVPPGAEQRAIAEALGDVDALLGALTRLIAKKRDLKQAAMQQLLTCQSRLPGFSGEWEVKRLGELAQIVSGGTPKTSVPAYWQGLIKWCTPTDITGCDGKYLSHTERSISREGLANCSARLLPAGSLLLCSRATIGEIRIAATEICTNQGFKSLICNRGVSNEFLYYMLLTMKSQMIEKAIGSTFLEISKKDAASLAIKLPQSEEQTAIATVLSDIDAELAALEARLAKTRALKQGMMQELLTGKTRLV